jgi:hypothetical protein
MYRRLYVAGKADVRPSSICDRVVAAEEVGGELVELVDDQVAHAGGLQAAGLPACSM